MSVENDVQAAQAAAATAVPTGNPAPLGLAPSSPARCRSACGWWVTSPPPTSARSRLPY
jgi:hypothetical protein